MLLSLPLKDEININLTISTYYIKNRINNIEK